MVLQPVEKVTLGAVGAAQIALPVIALEATGALPAAFSTSENGAVFFSGGAEAETAATSFAEATEGASTIYQTTGGRILSFADRFIRPVSQRFSNFLWDKASGYFAQGASGEVNVFLQQGAVNPTGAWLRTELPTLIQHGVRVIPHAVGP